MDYYHQKRLKNEYAYVVENYVNEVASNSDLERTSTGKK